MITIREDRCINCGRCVRVCPGFVLETGEERPAVAGERGCIRCLHCAAACPRDAIDFSGLDRPALPDDLPDGLERLVKTRRSCRSYGDRVPDRALLARALDDAAWAPSGKNGRAGSWTVIYGRTAMEETLRLATDRREGGKTAEIAGVIRRGKNLVTMDAPAAILCHCPEGLERHLVDAVIALTHVDLLLRDQGLGTCWGGYLTRVVNGAEAVRRYLRIPGGRRVAAALVTGYPKEGRYPNIPRRPEAGIDWITDREGQDE